MRFLVCFLPALLLCFAGPTSAAGIKVRINELNANIASGCDLVELRVVDCGNTKGLQLWQRTSPVLSFPQIDVRAGDLIVVHLNSLGVSCGGSAPDETLSTSQSPSSLYPNNFDTAFDLYSTVAGLTSTTNVLTLYDSLGAVVDAVLLSDGTSAPASATETQALAVVAAGQWSPATVTGAGFTSASVQDLNATGTARLGSSIQRTGDSDTDNLAGWTTGSGVPSTWGLLNPGQTEAFTCTAGVEHSSAPPGLMLTALPSVTNSRVSFRLGAPATEASRLEVFDAQGRLATMMWFLPGARELTWDLRDLSGRRAPAGSYFARVSSARGSGVTRVTLLR